MYVKANLKNYCFLLNRSASSALLTSTKVCDPLGDYNVYYSLFPRAKVCLNNIIFNIEYFKTFQQI